MAKNEIDRFWLVCRDDKVRTHSKYKKHPTLAAAVAEARRLAKKHSGNKFLVMEAIGGFMCPERKGMQEVKING